MSIAYDLNALSGINAASSGLAVISNNLANSQTVGFKSSRAEFADMFSGSQKSPGSGVRVDTITQDFNQGTITGTGRELDMAVDGDGFFILEDKTGKYDAVYTRNGSFKLEKDGFLTDQSNNRLQGYLLNTELSTETKPVFDTTLSSIDLDSVNKRPRATDEMNFDINLNSQQSNSVDKNAISTSTDSVGTGANLGKLIDPQANGAYGGSPTFTTNKPIHDTLGGEHRLTTNFYKRDVVPEVPGLSQLNQFTSLTTNYTAALGAYTAGDAASEAALVSAYNNLRAGFGAASPNTPTSVSAPGDTDANNAVAIAGDDLTTMAGAALEDTDLNAFIAANPNTAGEKYTSWIVQYTVQDYDDSTGQWVTSGHRYDQATNAVTAEAGQVFELRFDTSGALIDVRQPEVAGAYNSGAGVVGGTDDNGADLKWTSIGKEANLSFMIDAPLTGAFDPLGDPLDSTVSIALNFDEMSQFSGASSIRGVTQNGYKVGDLIGLTTGLDGVIQARYSNGRSVPVAQVALANFTDKNAMEKLGGQNYAETFASGTRQMGGPQSNGMGVIQAGSLEYSNVDVAGELVKMIQTQRMYQASAQVISTSQTLTQTILNL